MRWLRAFLRALTQRPEGGHVPTRRDHDADTPVTLPPGGHHEHDDDDDPSPIVEPGDMEIVWCPSCESEDLVRGDIYAVTIEGIYRIGEYAMCRECAYSPYAAQETR